MTDGERKPLFRDVSQEMFGKYRHCTMASDGLWYADEDFLYGNGMGPVLPGVFPAPRQDTPELQAKADAIRRAAGAVAVEAITKYLDEKDQPPKSDPMLDPTPIRTWKDYLRFAYAWAWFLVEAPWIILYWLIVGGPPRPWKRRWP